MLLQKFKNCLKKTSFSPPAENPQHALNVNDRGSLFFESNVKSPFPTLLHRWIIGLGVNFQHAKSFRPTNQAVIERTHQTMHKQIDQIDYYPSLQVLNELTHDRMHKLNTKITCSSLEMPPLVKYPNAIHSARNFSINEERTIFDFDPVTLNLNCFNAKELLALIPIKGLTYEELTVNF
ncbi:MAG: hypothetical protein ACKVU0_06645 [Saprospiraceae bacterium]